MFAVAKSATNSIFLFLLIFFKSLYSLFAVTTSTAKLFAVKSATNFRLIESTTNFLLQICVFL